MSPLPKPSHNNKIGYLECFFLSLFAMGIFLFVPKKEKKEKEKKEF